MLPFALRLQATTMLIAASFVQAQTPPKHFQGSVVRVSDDAITLQGKDGQSFAVQMTPGWTVSANRQASLEALKAGEFIASSNVPLDPGTGRSTEVRVLEPGYRPEQGTHPVSPTNSNMMTHGTVHDVRRTVDGVILEVVYPDGSRHLVVSASTPVTVSDLLDRSSLVPGTFVEGVTRQGTDGVWRSSRVQPAKQ